MNKIYFYFSLFILICCQNKDSVVEIEKELILNEYSVFIENNDDLIVTPNIIINNKNLFIYDVGTENLVEINNEKKIVNKFLRRGRGPGEVEFVSNIIFADGHIYVVDYSQLLINKYLRDGTFVDSFNYGEIIGPPSTPPVPITSSMVIANEIDNKPYIDLKGNVFLPTFYSLQNVDRDNLYTVFNWNGNELSRLGSPPVGSTFRFANLEYVNEVSKNEIPSFYKSNTFILNDLSDSSEVFVIYTSLPMIEKYNTNGDKIWDVQLKNSDIDSYLRNYFERMKRIKNTGDRYKLEIYSSGISNELGELFLAMPSYPLTIHHYSKKGKFIKSFKLESDSLKLQPIFDIDFEKNLIFVATETGEILNFHLE